MDGRIDRDFKDRGFGKSGQGEDKEERPNDFLHVDSIIERIVQQVNKLS
jgi:hypothetical protein